MSKPPTNIGLELLRLFDALRPKDYQVQIVAPDGSITHDAKFGTKDEAKRFATANRGAMDMVMTHFLDSAARN